MYLHSTDYHFRYADADFQDVVFAGCGKVFYGGKLLEKPEKIVVALCNARLLKNGFGNPDNIRVRNLSPWQTGTAVPFIPVFNNVGEFFQCRLIFFF